MPLSRFRQFYKLIKMLLAFGLEPERERQQIRLVCFLLGGKTFIFLENHLIIYLPGRSSRLSKGNSARAANEVKHDS